MDGRQHFPQLEPRHGTTISSPAAFPHQHGEAGHEEENGTNGDAAYDGADVVP